MYIHPELFHLPSLTKTEEVFPSVSSTYRKQSFAMALLAIRLRGAIVALWLSGGYRCPAEALVKSACTRKNQVGCLPQLIKKGSNVLIFGDSLARGVIFTSAL